MENTCGSCQHWDGFHARDNATRAVVSVLMCTTSIPAIPLYSSVFAGMRWQASAMEDECRRLSCVPVYTMALSAVLREMRLPA